MTRTERLRSQYAQAKAAWLAAVASGSGKAAYLHGKMTLAKEALDDAENGEIRQLGDAVPYAQLKKDGVPMAITMCIVACDLLQQCLYDLNRKYKRYGLVDHTLVPKVKAAISSCQEIIGIAGSPDLEGLQGYIDQDSDMIDQLQMLMRLDISEKLKIK